MLTCVFLAICSIRQVRLLPTRLSLILLRARSTNIGIFVAWNREMRTNDSDRLGSMIRAHGLTSVICVRIGVGT